MNDLELANIKLTFSYSYLPYILPFNFLTLITENLTKRPTMSKFNFMKCQRYKSID